MAQLQLQPVTPGKKNRAHKAQLKIDMTPMVDLGFLLITFFIFTTTMSKPAITKLYMPADGDSTKLKEDAALTVLLAGNDSIFYYQGKLEDALKKNELNVTNYNIKTGIGNIIREKQKNLGSKKNNLMLLIKPLESSSYNNLMNTLDEVMINDIKRYAIVEAMEQERGFVSKRMN
jgi:biopolymer transport protein ExbD